MFLAEHGVGDASDTAAALREAGHTLVGVARAGRLLGWIGLVDRVRPGAAAAVAALRDIGVRVVMITGDHQGTAMAVAREVGISEVSAGVLPGGKADAVRTLKAGGGVVGMAGDGVNDAPAIAAADVSFAIGAGSAVAIQAADVTLVRDDLGAIADAVLLSRATLANDQAQPGLCVRLQRTRHSACRVRLAEPGRGRRGDGRELGFGGPERAVAQAMAAATAAATVIGERTWKT